VAPAYPVSATKVRSAPAAVHFAATLEAPPESSGVPNVWRRRYVSSGTGCGSSHPRYHGPLPMHCGWVQVQ
jgi:hypothetical protein